MDLIHPTGMKLFGKYLIRNELVNDEITLESSTIFPDRNFFTVDTDIFTSDRDGITVDLYNDVEYTADSSTLLSDNSTFTVDKLFS